MERVKAMTTYTHTHPFNGPFSGTTQVIWYQKGKTNLDFSEARDSEWQWHQLGHMQVCTSLQTDNHTSTPPQMEKGDKGSTLTKMGVSGWMFLLVPAYPGCPGQTAVKWLLLLLLLLYCKTQLMLQWILDGVHLAVILMCSYASGKSPVCIQGCQSTHMESASS